VDGCIYQDARDVRTKASKTIESWFFPEGDDIAATVAEWVTFLKTERQWGLDDPLFPKTHIVRGSDRNFQSIGLERECWANATPIRAIFKRAFESALLPNFNPHSFRNTLVRLGLEICPSPEAFKAWSQNIGHEDALITFTSYGQVERLRQRDIMRQLALPPTSDDPSQLLAKLTAAMAKRRKPT
jgi:integrase/recombinase XerD